MKATVVLINNPFQPTASVVEEIECSQTIRGWLDEHDIEEFKSPTICLFNGEPLLRSDWETTVLSDGDLVGFIAMAAGGGGDGGSDPLMVIGMLALMWVSFGLIGGLVQGALLPSGVVAADVAAAAAMGVSIQGVAGAVIAGKVAAMATMMIGGQLLGLFKPPKVDNKTPTAVYRQGAQNNQARLQQPIPVVYGRMRVIPDYASQPYTEFEPGTGGQVLNQLLCIGQGHYDVHEVYVGDNPFTPIRDTDEVEYELIKPGRRISLFPSNVVTNQDVRDIDLISYNVFTNSRAYPKDVYEAVPPGDNKRGAPTKDGWAGPYTINRTSDQLSQISLDFFLPAGLYSGDNHRALVVPLRVECRLLGVNGEESDNSPFQEDIIDELQVHAADRSAEVYLFWKDPDRKWRGRGVSAEFPNGRTTASPPPDFVPTDVEIDYVRSNTINPWWPGRPTVAQAKAILHPNLDMAPGDSRPDYREGTYTGAKVYINFRDPETDEPTRHRLGEKPMFTATGPGEGWQHIELHNVSTAAADKKIFGIHIDKFNKTHRFFRINNKKGYIVIPHETLLNSIFGGSASATHTQDDNGSPTTIMKLSRWYTFTSIPGSGSGSGLNSKTRSWNGVDYIKTPGNSAPIYQNGQTVHLLGANVVIGPMSARNPVQRTYTAQVFDITNKARQTGRFEVRIMRTWESSLHVQQDKQWVDTCHFTGLRGTIPTVNAFGDVTLLAMKSRTSANVSQQQNTKISCLVTRRLRVPEGVGSVVLDATLGVRVQQEDMPWNRIILRGLGFVGATTQGTGLTLDSTTAFRGIPTDHLEYGLTISGTSGKDITVGTLPEDWFKKGQRVEYRAGNISGLTDKARYYIQARPNSTTLRLSENLNGTAISVTGSSGDLRAVFDTIEHDDLSATRWKYNLLSSERQIDLPFVVETGTITGVSGNVISRSGLAGLDGLSLHITSKTGVTEAMRWYPVDNPTIKKRVFCEHGSPTVTVRLDGDYRQGGPAKTAYVAGTISVGDKMMLQFPPQFLGATGFGADLWTRGDPEYSKLSTDLYPRYHRVTKTLTGYEEIPGEGSVTGKYVQFDLRGPSGALRACRLPTEKEEKKYSAGGVTLQVVKDSEGKVTDAYFVLQSGDGHAVELDDWDFLDSTVIGFTARISVEGAFSGGGGFNNQTFEILGKDQAGSNYHKNTSPPTWTSNTTTAPRVKLNKDYFAYLGYTSYPGLNSQFRWVRYTIHYDYPVQPTKIGFSKTLKVWQPRLFEITGSTASAITVGGTIGTQAVGGGQTAADIENGDTFRVILGPHIRSGLSPGESDGNGGATAVSPSSVSFRDPAEVVKNDEDDEVYVDNGTATRSIAWALLDAATGAYGGQLVDTEVDIANTLKSYNQVWADRGDTFNGVFDTQQGLWEVLNSITQAGRANVQLDGGVVTISRDERKTLAAAMFNERNITKGSLNMGYRFVTPDEPDSVLIEYLDENNWKTQEVHSYFVTGYFGMTQQAASYLDSVTDISLNRSTNKFSKTAHGFLDGDYVKVSGTSLPSEIAADVGYYVIKRTANVFQISTKVAGDAVKFASSGTLDVTVTRLTRAWQQTHLDGKIYQGAFYDGALDTSIVKLVGTAAHAWTSDVVGNELVFLETTTMANPHKSGSGGVLLDSQNVETRRVITEFIDATTIRVTPAGHGRYVVHSVAGMTGTYDDPDPSGVDDTDQSADSLHFYSIEQAKNTQPETSRVIGITNRDQAWREGIHRVAANRLRRKVITFETELEGYIPTYGSKVLVTHAMPDWGQTAEVTGYAVSDPDPPEEPVATVTLSVDLIFRYDWNTSNVSTPETFNTSIITVTDGSRRVVVEQPNHRHFLDDDITITGVTAPVGGVPSGEINDTVKVIEIIDPDTWVFMASTKATADATGSGNNITIGQAGSYKDWQIWVAFRDKWGEPIGPVLATPPTPNAVNQNQLTILVSGLPNDSQDQIFKPYAEPDGATWDGDRERTFVSIGRGGTVAEDLRITGISPRGGLRVEISGVNDGGDDVYTADGTQAASAAQPTGDIPAPPPPGPSIPYQWVQQPDGTKELQPSIYFSTSSTSAGISVVVSWKPAPGGEYYQAQFANTSDPENEEFEWLQGWPSAETEVTMTEVDFGSLTVRVRAWGGGAWGGVGNKKWCYCPAYLRSGRDANRGGHTDHGWGNG